ncbi:hypothetical protein [Bacillus alkalicellulosilyticus]|uniref:hypothetical protein n=1 Tax=Alkalihalobacterium alkalicellulosilyticum TaxID=1912214 RepID=UPI000996B79C|nr:hypothetical protein [Bacillus alkalicellulosilyticus]
MANLIFIIGGVIIVLAFMFDGLRLIKNQGVVTEGKWGHIFGFVLFTCGSLLNYDPYLKWAVFGLFAITLIITIYRIRKIGNITIYYTTEEKVKEIIEKVLSHHNILYRYEATKTDVSWNDGIYEMIDYETTITISSPSTDEGEKKQHYTVDFKKSSSFPDIEVLKEELLLSFREANEEKSFMKQKIIHFVLPPIGVLLVILFLNSIS